jgi:hypothetical protein
MTRSTTTSPPGPAEIRALLCTAEDLRDDPATTDADRLAYFECKADLLARIAAHDATETAQRASRHAAAQVRRFRARVHGDTVGRWSA